MPLTLKLFLMFTATQRLDDDLADYWKKDEAADAAAPAVAGTETAAVAEEKKE